MTVKCEFIEPSVLSDDQIIDRLAEFEAWFASRWPHSVDPRCGCAAPDDICEWDDVRLLEDLL